ncbi:MULTISPECIES: hypothetical protein [unclassified Streptomyces]|uniref:hypothetical protein n=1 Tax=unclassified Streptomyces TaxID=2593676 RepID=UPI00278C5F81|nr:MULTISPECIES: hypothetical protein [unclassified Streptomyces]
MSDLAKDSESIRSAASALRRVGQHTERPLQAFVEQSHDLSALGALGSLMSATDDIADAMDTLGKMARQLNEEWDEQATAMTEVSDAFDHLDALLSGDDKR